MSQATPPSLGTTTSPTSRPTGFVVGAFVLATLVGVSVLYLGLNGGFGGTIPGSHTGPPQAPGGRGPDLAACEGKDRLGTFTFSFVAGSGGTTKFNGTSPGPCVAVAVGSQVTVNFSVASDAGANHSWVLVEAANASSAVSTPVFPGAGFTGADRFMGIAPGAWLVFHFNATAAGTYQYICEMSGHYALGMYGWFYVSASASS
jgi:FtsP/CotA-like multicopper oxidase with cupredoxin domain